MRNMDSKSSPRVVISEKHALDESGSASSGSVSSEPLAGTVKRWPQTPQSTLLSRPIRVFHAMYDALLIAMPIALIVKAALCIVATQIDWNNTGPNLDSVSLLTQKLVAFNGQFSTISTVVFLMVMGTFFRRYALWRAERGAPLAELEVLQSSISPISTIKAILSLRMFRVATLGLASLWIWYYAMSQANEREFGLRPSLSTGPQRLAFFAANVTSPFEDIAKYNYSTYTEVAKTDMKAMYNTYSQKLKGGLGIDSNGVDMLGYPLPIWFDPANPAVKPDKHGWSHIKGISTGFSVASSIGSQPFLLINQTSWTWAATQLVGKYEYNASYLGVACDSLQLSTKAAPAGLIATLTMSYNLTVKSNDSTVPRSFDFWSRFNTTHAITSRCGVWPTDVTLRIKCDDASVCKVIAIKPRPGFDPNNARTKLFDNDDMAQDFINNLLLAGGRPATLKNMNLIEQDNGVNDVINGLANGETWNTSMQYSSLGAVTTRHFNTFLEACKYMKYTNGPQWRTSLYYNNVIHDPDPNGLWQFVNMPKGAEYNPNYNYNLAWIIVDITSSLVLLTAAVLALWFRLHTSAPDVLGYVSSLTRENPRLDVPGGSALHGLDRSRKMKNVQVKIAEVPTDGEYGKIGLSYVGSQEEGVRDLERGKRYI